MTVASAAPTPSLSIVVVIAPDHRQHLSECLDSLVQQSLGRLEVILVAIRPDGACDGLTALRREAARDDRIRVLPKPAPGFAEARWVGARAARGRYVTFVDPDDTIPSGAYRTAVRTLRRSGSDLAVGAVTQVRHGRASRPPWVKAAHGLDRRNLNLDDFPQAMQDVFGRNRVFRRRFLLREVVGSTPAVLGSDLLLSVAAYTRARSFDLVATVTYQWHVRHNSSTLVQRRYDLAHLETDLPDLEATWRLLSAEASERVAAAWLGGVIESRIGDYLEHAVGSGPAYQQRLQVSCIEFLAAAGPLVWPQVRVDRRLRLWLGAQGRWSALEQLLEHMRLNGVIPPTEVVDGRVEARLPLDEVLGTDVPAQFLQLPDSQTVLSACLQRVTWTPGRRLKLTGWAFVSGVDLTGVQPEQQAELVDAGTGATVTLTVQPRPDKAATRWASQLHHTYDNGGFALEVDVDALPPPALGTVRRWALRLTVTARGVTRSGPVTSVDRSGSAGRLQARPLQHPDEAIRQVALLDPELGFTVQARPDRFRAAALIARPGGRLEGRIMVLDGTEPAPNLLLATNGPDTVPADVRTGTDGSTILSLTLPVDGTPRRWQVRAIDAGGHQQRVSWPDEATAGLAVGEGGVGRAAWARSARGYMEATTDFVGLAATHVRVDVERVVVEVVLTGLKPTELAGALLRGHRGEVPVTTTEVLAPDRVRLAFPAQASFWGRPAAPLPSGTYTVVLPGRGLTCGVDPVLLDRCPLESLSALHHVRVARSPAGDTLALKLSAPLALEERGRRAQRLLALEYEQNDHTPQDAVLFQCYRGEFATDSQLALHQELRRRGSKRALLWAVADLSVELPEGAEPVLLGSRAWYAALASSRYLCQNIDADRFFRKRPHQRYLQTFHGYPFKSMGVSLWQAQGRTEGVIDVECRRRTDAWDAIIVPEEFCVPLYREEYRYSGEVLVTGYPRDDALVAADAAGVRAEVRRRLGIRADDTVVLYAPTWRDTVATGAFRAKLFAALDLDQLSAELGPDHVILVRGHNYNLREGESFRNATVLDVTSYPEVNELILAADAALLDYSSLRFDWLITGKPVLFFVPDLHDYLSSRTALYDYEPTAPGPLLTTTAEVASALRNLDSVSTRYAEERAAFNRRYNRLQDGRAAERVADAFFD